MTPSRKPLIQLDTLNTTVICHWTIHGGCFLSNPTLLLLNLYIQVLRLAKSGRFEYIYHLQDTSYLVIKKLHATIRIVRDTILDESEIPFQVLTKLLNSPFNFNLKKSLNKFFYYILCQNK